MIGTVEFIKSAGSMTTAEHPLLSSDADIDAYVVKTYENVMFVEDLAQTLTMPSFDGWSECNMVRFKQSSNSNPWVAYYWITDAVRSSDVDGATMFNLEFNPVATLLRKGDTLDGIWLRSPFNYTPWKQQAVASGTMRISREEPIATLMPEYYSSSTGTLIKPMIWVSITATKNPDAVQGSYELYGFPVSLADDSIQSLYYDGDAGHVPSNATDANGNYLDFPTLSDIFTGDILTTTGLTASEILDVSITPYRPFDCMIMQYGTVYRFVMGGGTALDPKPVQVKYNDGTKDALSKYAMYNLTSATGRLARPYQTQLTLSLSDMEYSCGQLSVMKGDGTIVQAIPTGLFDAIAGSGHYVNICTRVICDYCQIVMECQVTNAGATDPELLFKFTVPCTHIPYIGNQWDNYRAYSMSYDREAMEFSLNQAKDALIVNSAISIANSAISTATGAANQLAQGKSTTGTAISGASSMASTALGIVGNIYAYHQQKEAAQFNQQLTERKTQTQPGNSYGAQYGLFNLLMDLENPISVVVSLPFGLTEDVFNEFIEDFGYANEGAKELDITYGFYQGTIRTSPTLTGPRLASLINAFNAGIRLIPAGGKT